MSVLDVPMDPDRNDAKAETIGGYLIALLAALWEDGSDFSAKRPFGNSGWEHDLYAALISAGHIDGAFDEDGYIDRISAEERDRADTMIAAAIQELAATPAPIADHLADPGLVETLAMGAADARRAYRLPDDAIVSVFLPWNPAYKDEWLAEFAAYDQQNNPLNLSFDWYNWPESERP